MESKELKLFLLPGPHFLPSLHERLVPYFEAAVPSPDIDKGTEAAGVIGRLKRKIGEAHRKLSGKFPLHERLCTALAEDLTIHVTYPASVGRDEAQHAFEHFLRFRISKHRFWTGVYGALAGIGALLTPLPGPNFFFFYPAVRALGHQRAGKGARAAMHAVVKYEADARLGRFLTEIHGKPRHAIEPLLDGLGADLQLTGLAQFYRKHVLRKHSKT